MHAQLLSHVWFFVILCPWNSSGKNTGVGCHFLLDVVQLLSHVWLFVTPWIAPRQASQSFTISWSLLKLKTIDLEMLSNYLILCLPVLPCLNLSQHEDFSNESVLHIRWPKYWSLSFNIRPSNEYSALISFRIDWLDLFAVQGTLRSLLQHHSSKASILQTQLSSQSNSHPYRTLAKP